MPEYLAPGVYVEEVDLSARPIEGVSTSTAGMVGVTERGPVNVPIFVSSTGEFTRWFGERLNLLEFSNGDDAHAFLPHAVEGFFTNGGKRLYVTRVLDTDGAVAASTFLFDRGGVTSANTMLLRAAGELTGTAANQPFLYVLDTGDLNPLPAADSWIRIGDGSHAEYRQVAASPLDTTHVPLDYPLGFSHPTGAANIYQFTPADDAVMVFQVEVASQIGDEAVILSGANAALTALDNLVNIAPPPVPPLIRIGPANGGEHRFVSACRISGPTVAMPVATIRVELSGGGLVRAYPQATPCAVVTIPVAPGVDEDDIDLPVSAGDRMVFVNDRNGNFDVRTDLVILESADARREVRRIGELGVLTVATGAHEDYPAGSLVERVDFADDDYTLAAAAAAAATSITLNLGSNDFAHLQPGVALLIGTGPTQETIPIVSVAAPNQVNLPAAGLVNAHAAGEPVVPAFSQKTLTSAARANSTVLALDNRISLNVGDLVRVGAAPDEEVFEIVAIPNRAPAGVSPDAGNVLLSSRLRAYPTGTPVRRQTPAVLAVIQPTTLAIEAVAGSTSFVVTDGNGYALNFFLRVRTATGETFLHRLTANFAAATPAEVEVSAALDRAHPEGSVIAGRNPLIEVRAIDFGAWGNRIRISVEDEGTGAVSRTTMQTLIDPLHIRLGSAAGVEAGTVLELLDPLNGDAVIGEPIKAVLVDRQANFTITLAGTGLSVAQQAAHVAATGAGTRLGVRSREFRLTAYLLHQLDPARPSRNDLVIDLEVFRYLSLDPRHSRYIHRVIGDIQGELRPSDRRPEGESWYIRVHDLAQDLPEPARTTALESVRLGPEALIDLLPTGQRRPARHALRGGDDSIATLTDAQYVGTDNIDPDLRTGLFTFVNIDDISILAAPGRTTVTVHNALITQCENLRYRFAVLDGPRPPNDTLTDVQDQRQQYDTLYASLYYPWLQTTDPFPVSLNDILPYPIPPSGHVVGIYARTDIERGVHKAPANEVVRGIVGLQRTVSKAEHDILNPFPVNINVIRDFRPDNRGIRVWGGRVITSDPAWKYLNVRRLIIFIEKSLDIGLQWVVFEPNSDQLWARVRRTIGNFLTTVWRNGALEGLTREEAYFVKCDRTTMTQTDIDNGRLIVVIGVAPVKPAEYVIIRIGLWTAHAEE